MSAVGFGESLHNDEVRRHGMAWESRGSRRYFYEAAWVDGRCVKRYVGSGIAAKTAADRVAAKASQRAMEATEALKFQKAIDPAERLFATAAQHAESAFESGMLSLDCYQASHTWRRRRQNGDRDG